MKTVNIKMYTANEKDGRYVIVAHVEGLGYAPSTFSGCGDEWLNVDKFLPYNQWAYADEEYFDSLANVKLIWKENAPVEE